MLVDGLLELTVGEHGSTRQPEVAVDFHHHVDFVGGSHTFVEDGRIGVVQGIGCIDVGHHSNRLVGALHALPSVEPLVGLAHEVEGDVLERGADDFNLVVFLLRQRLSGEFLLAHLQEELCLLVQPFGGGGSLLGHQVELLQHVVGHVEQRDGFLPEPHVGLHIALHGGLGWSVVATFGSHGLLGVEDGVVFQLGPRGKGGVQVFLLPLLRLHEVGVTGVGVVHVGQRGNPSFGDSLVPTNLLHALLHLREHRFERLPTRVVVLLVDEYSFGGSASERCEDVEATGNGALGGFVIRIDHLVQHLGVGLVALGHEVDLVGAGGLELRTDARLLLGGLLDGCTHLGKVFLARNDGLGGLSRLLQLVVDLQDGDVVGLAHQEGDGFEEGVVEFLDARVAAHNLGHEQRRLELLFLVGSEVHTLQPHHGAEVAFDFLGTGVMAARSVERIGVFHILVVKELGIVVLGVHHLADFVVHHLCVIGVYGRSRLAIDEGCCDGEIGLVELARGLHRFAHGRGEMLVELDGEQVDDGVELLFLNAAQHVVEIEVVELQIEVGGHKRRKVAVVVLLVDVEELYLVPWHDGEAVLSERRLQLGLEGGELVGVQKVVDIHQLTALRVEVLLAQLLLASLYLGDESLFGGCVFQGHRLVGAVVLIAVALGLVFFLELRPHEGVVP